MNYDDIIDLPHHVSTRHPQMSALDRAAQFAPFAALTGHEAAIRETGRLTEDFLELDEEQKELLDQKLRILKQAIQDSNDPGAYPEIEVLVFLPDAKKSGGSYERVRGRVEKIDEYRRKVLLAGLEPIPMDRLIAMEGEVFRKMGLEE